MFNSKGLFSQITCPYNGECMLPKCLFAHPTSTLPAEPADSTFQNAAIQKETDASHDGQRKRPRLSVGESAQGTTSTKAAQGQDARKTSTLSSASRDVSPPPLRRLTPSGSASKTPPAKPVPATRVKEQLKPQEKEELNPRLLKHSPASHDLRFRLVKALHDQLARLNNELAKATSSGDGKLVKDSQELIVMALDIEMKAAVEKPSIYSNVVKNNILVYKRMTVEQWKVERQKELDAVRAQQATEVKVSAPPPSPKSIETGLTEAQELQLLPKLYTPLNGLEKHGYVSAVPDEKAVALAQKGVEASQGWEVCDRCKTRFQVFPGRRESDGALTSGGICTHHWGKIYWQDRPANDPKAKREKRFRCCGEMVGDSAGCTQGPTHVFKVSEVKRLAALMNFETTPENDTASDQPVCIDGEMGYTVHGLELLRLTATSWPSGAELLDVLVRPIGEILDLNSRWSGVYPQHLTDALPYSSSKAPTKDRNEKQPLRIVNSPQAARTLLFAHLRPSTALIGHGLENDLNAVRIVHPTIIDTALLFPHKAGLPYRNALKMLVQTHLGRQIQGPGVEGSVQGHDSKEDANAAGDLVRWKLGEEWRRMQRAGWTLEGGKFVAKGVEGGLTEEFLERKIEPSGELAEKGKKRMADKMEKDEVEEGGVAEG